MFNLNHNRTPEQMAVLAKLYTMAMANCKLYGKSKQDVIEAVESLAFFTRNLPFEPMCQAFLEHVESKGELPTGADLNNRVFPPKPEITLGEYLQACDYQKRNNYPLYSDAYELKQAYEAQQREKREGWEKRHAEQLALVQEKAPSLLIQDESNDHE